MSSPILKTVDICLTQLSHPGTTFIRLQTSVATIPMLQTTT